MNQLRQFVRNKILKNAKKVFGYTFLIVFFGIVFVLIAYEDGLLAMAQIIGGTFITASILLGLLFSVLWITE